jgi:hypothetical protein
MSSRRSLYREVAPVSRSFAAGGDRQRLRALGRARVVKRHRADVAGGLTRFAGCSRPPQGCSLRLVTALVDSVTSNTLRGWSRNRMANNAQQAGSCAITRRCGLRLIAGSSPGCSATGDCRTSGSRTASASRQRPVASRVAPRAEASSSATPRASTPPRPAATSPSARSSGACVSRRAVMCAGSSPTEPSLLARQHHLVCAAGLGGQAHIVPRAVAANLSNVPASSGPVRPAANARESSTRALRPSRPSAGMSPSLRSSISLPT